MFEREARELKEIYDKAGKTEQDEMDQYIRNAMPYLRAVVKAYDNLQHILTKSEEIEFKLNKKEQEDE